jgi:hypothetical protein
MPKYISFFHTVPYSPDPVSSALNMRFAGPVFLLSSYFATQAFATALQGRDNNSSDQDDGLFSGLNVTKLASTLDSLIDGEESPTSSQTAVVASTTEAPSEEAIPSWISKLFSDVESNGERNHRLESLLGVLGLLGMWIV